MKPDETINTLLNNYAGVVVMSAWGESSLFYNPNRILPRGVYFVTIKEKDGENDKVSNLTREGIFRLSIGVSKSTYIEHFGRPPSRPAKGKVIEGSWNFTETNKLLPHPVYAWMGWVAVNSPTRETFDSLSPLFDSAYQKALLSFKKR